jgi:hypothetical protein
MSDEINIQFTRFMRAYRHRYEDVVAAPPAA